MRLIKSMIGAAVARGRGSARVAIRKARAVAGQPEAKMGGIALSGIGTVKMLWWLNHLPVDALSISPYPYHAAAMATAGLAWGFYASFGLKREADALPKLRERIKAA